MFPLLPQENAKKFSESLNIGYKQMITFEATRLKIQVAYYRFANN